MYGDTEKYTERTEVWEVCQANYFSALLCKIKAELVRW